MRSPRILFIVANPLQDPLASANLCGKGRVNVLKKIKLIFEDVSCYAVGLSNFPPSKMSSSSKIL